MGEMQPIVLQVFYKTDTGELLTIDEVPDISLGMDLANDADFMNFRFDPVTIDMAMIFPCRSRKRFVKLLMGRGYSRNQANAAARQIVSEGKSYKDELWRRLLIGPPGRLIF